MLNEVYLMSSLPSLSFGQAPPISLDEFGDMARSELSARSYKLLDRVNIQRVEGKGRKAKHRKVSAMQDGLQKELNGIRSARAQDQKARPELLPESILEANPLDREIQIMQWQWEMLDAMQAGKAFTLHEVIAYKLKLQLLFRLQSFNVERGTAVLDSVVNPQKRRRADGNTEN